MAQISIPYVQRQLARANPSGGGGGGLAVVRQPRLPETSGIYKPLTQLGENLSQDLSEVADVLGRQAAAQRKARDVATLTEFETGADEALGLKAVEIKNDARNHPDDWAPMLQQYREELFKERSKDLRSDLIPLARGKVWSGTARTIIDAKADGAKISHTRAMDALKAYEDNKLGRMLTETDETQYNLLRDQLRDKYTEYEQSGRLSPQDRLKREYDADQRLLETGATLDMQQDGKGTLARLEKGDYQGLSPETRVKLIDKAQGERKAQAEWQDQQDRRAERVTAEQQAVRSSEIRTQVYALKGGPQAIKLINDARANREISEQDHASILGFAIATQNHQASMANMAASRAASLAQKADIERRRQEENAAGTMLAHYASGQPGPDGQMISIDGVMNALHAGKLSGSVAAPLVVKMDAHERLLMDAATTETKQTFDRAMTGATHIFEQSGLRPSRSAEADQSFAAFYEEMERRVFRGKEDPRTVSDEILGRHIAGAKGLESKRTDAILRGLPLQYRTTPEEGIEPALTKLQDDWLHGLLKNEEEYTRLARQLKELGEFSEFLLKRPKPKTTLPGSALPEPEAAAPPPPTPGYGERVKRQAIGAFGGIGRLLPTLDEPLPPGITPGP